MDTHIIKLGILGANSYLLCTSPDKPAILIDAGCNVHKVFHIVDKNASGIAAVFLTHGHFDHIHHIDEIRKKYNPKVYLHKDDAHMLIDPKENLSDKFPVKNLIHKEADILINDGDEYTVEGIKIKVMHTPGHTMGSCVFLVDGYAYTGDTLFCNSIGRFDFPHSDFKMMLTSLHNIKTLIPKTTKIYPGHGKSTILKDEIEKNPHLQF